MKQALLLCLISLGALAAPAKPPQLKPFSAVVWTTTTLHTPSGKAVTFMRRTVFTRDNAGNVRREMYKTTKGQQHDTTAPLERVITGTTSTQTLTLGRSSNETLEQDVDLGTLQVSGVPAKGRRQTFQDATGQRTHSMETWFSPTLGLTVHTESRNLNKGDSVVSDLSELQFGEPPAPSAATVPVAGPTIPLLVLYRGLFTHIAHMERDRLADDPNRLVNMEQIEDHLRTKLALSPTDWQLLVAKSVEVEAYTREMSNQAHSFAVQDRAARRADPLTANTLAAGRAKLHTMQLDLNTHIQKNIDELYHGIGPEAKERIETYLQGPMAASTSLVSVRTSQMHAHQARKEQSQ